MGLYEILRNLKNILKSPCDFKVSFGLFNRFYTIRYREKDKEKKWIFQLCPATETIVENLKPNTVYEFGVKDNVEGGIWSKIFNHKTIVGSKYLKLF